MTLHRAFARGLVLLVSAIAATSNSAIGDQGVPTFVFHIHDRPLPVRLDFSGPAVRPTTQFIPCAVGDRKKAELDVDAVSSLVDEAGGMRLREADFPEGKEVTTADGLRLTLQSTVNGSYVVAIDSSHASGVPQQYLLDCVALFSATDERIRSLGLELPAINPDTPQYSPAIGFYIPVAQ